MENDDPRYHYGEGHFCAGCTVSNELHAGCVTNGNVIFPESTPPTSVETQTGEEDAAES